MPSKGWKSNEDLAGSVAEHTQPSAASRAHLHSLRAAGGATLGRDAWERSLQECGNGGGRESKRWSTMKPVGSWAWKHDSPTPGPPPGKQAWKLHLIGRR